MKQKSIINLSFLIIAFVFLQACEKTVTIDIPQKPSRLVVNSILETNLPIGVFVGKSRHILDSDNTNWDTYVVKNAVTVLFENNIPIDTLVYDPNKFSYLSVKNTTVKTGNVYTIKVTAPGFNPVEATSIVPTQSEIGEVTHVKNAKVNSAGEQMDEVTIKLNDPVEKNFYLVQIIRAGFGNDEFPVHCVSTTDKDLEQIGDAPDPLSTDNCYDGGNLIMRDDNFNGQQKFLRFYIHSYEMNEYTGPTGQIEKPSVKVSRITEEHFKFIKSYHVYYVSSDNPFAEPANVFSNVKDGYGIFAIRTSVKKTL